MRILSLFLLTLIFVFPAHARRIKPQVICDVAIKCAAPPEGCNWSLEMDANNCPVSCGKLICDEVLCPVPVCPAPPMGCSYLPPALDENKCQIGCGELNCPVTCNNVQAPQCAAPPKGCSWTMLPGEDGCPSCGQLICDPAGGGGYDVPTDGPTGSAIAQ